MINVDTKTVRIKVDVYERVKKFGVAGDSISDAIENAIVLAEKVIIERRKWENEINAASDLHPI